MTINLHSHQVEAVKELKNGSILCGGVGSGKSLTALSYYHSKECDDMRKPKNLYIITTPQKRDNLEWEHECLSMLLSKDSSLNPGQISIVIDSWNNLHKYTAVDKSFFIFDEQRLVGSGTWVKSYLKIVKKNNWILLSATPGDTWLDYIPVFIANGFYKNRTEFLRTHVVYNNFTKFPKVDHYIECGRLVRHKQNIIVMMSYEKRTVAHHTIVPVLFDETAFSTVKDKRWNIFKNKPIKDISELCFVMRQITNSDPSRLTAIQDILAQHKKVIVFYNFNYELDILRSITSGAITVAEYNGHRHDRVPTSDRWVYLVQYTSGSEGWNCITTNAVIFYSQNYSYRSMVQAAGRIDRINTPFTDLYYYHLLSSSWIDQAIGKALRNKKDFNEKRSKK